MQHGPVRVLGGHQFVPSLALLRAADQAELQPGHCPHAGRHALQRGHRLAQAAGSAGADTPAVARGRQCDPALAVQRTAARGRHTRSRVLRGTGRLCRRRGSGLVRARASATTRIVPPAYRVQHALRHPELAREAFVEHLERERERVKAQRRPPRRDDPHGHLMKYGPEPNHWNEYILCAYTGHRHEAIFLTGIPDIRESLPHASTYR